MGSRHLHDRGLGRTRPHRPPVRPPPRASTAPSGRGAADRGPARGPGARLPSARRPPAPSLAGRSRAGHAPARAPGRAPRGARTAPAPAAAHRGGGPGDRTRVGDLVVRAVPARHDGRRLPVGPHRSPRWATSWRARRGPTSPGTPGCSTTWPRRSGRSTWRCCRWAAGVRISARDISTRAARPRPSPGSRRASAVPVHYGTYWPIGMDAVRPHEFHTPGDEFVRIAAQLAPSVSVHRLGHGESVRPEVAR